MLDRSLIVCRSFVPMAQGWHGEICTRWRLDIKETRLDDTVAKRHLRRGFIAWQNLYQMLKKIGLWQHRIYHHSRTRCTWLAWWGWTDWMAQLRFYRHSSEVRASCFRAIISASLLPQCAVCLSRAVIEAIPGHQAEDPYQTQCQHIQGHEHVARAAGCSRGALFSSATLGQKLHVTGAKVSSFACAYSPLVCRSVMTRILLDAGTSNHTVKQSAVIDRS